MYESKTLAQWYTLGVGLLMLTLGVLGLAIGPVAGLDASRDDFFSKFLFEPGHDSLYVLAGLLGLATWRRADSARLYAMTLGLVYLALAVWGFVASGVSTLDPGFGLLAHELEANIFHTLFGAASVAIGFTAPRHGSYPSFAATDGA